MIQKTSAFKPTNVFLFTAFLLLFPFHVQAQTRQQKVLGDKLKFEATGSWFYNDLEKGFEAATRLKQPMLVVLRCIPCEECVKLDDELVDKDERLRPLLEKFVRVENLKTLGNEASEMNKGLEMKIVKLKAPCTSNSIKIRSDQQQAE